MFPWEHPSTSAAGAVLPCLMQHWWKDPETSLGSLRWFMALSNDMSALWPCLVESAVSSQKRCIPSGFYDTSSSWRWEKICTIKSIMPSCWICLSVFPLSGSKASLLPNKGQCLMAILQWWVCRSEILPAQSQKLSSSPSFGGYKPGLSKELTPFANGCLSY